MWYYKIKDKIYGPIETTELISKGVFTKSTLVKEENSDKWEKITDNNYIFKKMKDVDYQKRLEKELKKEIYKEMFMLNKIERS